MRKNRFLSMLLSVLLLVSLLAVPAAAADEGPVEDLGYAGEEAGEFFFGTEEVTNAAAGATTYTPSGYYYMTANGTYFRVPIANNNGVSISGAKVTSYKSSDTSVASLKMLNGECVATSKKAGFVTLTVSNGTYTTVWHIISQFTDVTSQSSDFHTPVYWALNNGITTGRTANTFAPYSGCTRAQIVTFLYRYAGTPSVPASRTNPFRDIKPTDYFYKAVLWAVDKGITTGKTSTTFAPNQVCTREQCVTFLWRFAGSPSAGTNSGFYDVNSSAYYAQAVTWAVNNNITKGKTSTSFGVGQSCTRGQIATFLWRFDRLFL